MKVRMKTSIMGSYYGIPAQHIYSVNRGDIIDLAEPEWILHEVKNDRVELALSGPIGEQRLGSNVKDLAVVKKMVAARRPNPAEPAGRTTGRAWDGATYIYPAD